MRGINFRGFRTGSHTSAKNVSTINKPVSKSTAPAPSVQSESKNSAPAKPLTAQGKTQLKAETKLQGTAKQADLEGMYSKGTDGKWTKVGEHKPEITGREATLGKKYQGEEKEATFRNEGKTPKGGVHKTEYFNSKQQKQHEIGVKNGKIIDSKGKALDTTGAKGGLQDAAEDRMIFSMKDGKVQAADARKETIQHHENMQKGKTNDMNFVHHSSFFQGKSVQGAGELEVKNGELKTISNRSGHYSPDVNSGLQTLQKFQKDGVDINNTKYQMYTKDSNGHVKDRTRYATEVMAAKGDVKAIDNKIAMLDELKGKGEVKPSQLKPDNGYSKTPGSSEYSKTPNSEYSKTPNSEYAKTPNSEYTKTPNSEYTKSPAENNVYSKTPVSDSGYSKTPVSNEYTKSPASLKESSTQVDGYDKSPASLQGKKTRNPYGVQIPVRA
jgi:hypothetical protein